MSTDTKPNMEQLLTELGKAEAAFRAARQRAESAAQDEATALNWLNDMQKAFDEAAACRRKDAPSGSDWTRGRGEAA